METYIIYALALTLLQLWIIPMALNFKNLSWMMSSRDRILILHQTYIYKE